MYAGKNRFRDREREIKRGRERMRERDCVDLVMI